MADDAIPLHLSEAQAAIPRPTLDWLTGEDLGRGEQDGFWGGVVEAGTAAKGTEGGKVRPTLNRLTGEDLGRGEGKGGGRWLGWLGAAGQAATSPPGAGARVQPKRGQPSTS